MFINKQAKKSNFFESKNEF